MVGMFFVQNEVVHEIKSAPMLDKDNELVVVCIELGDLMDNNRPYGYKVKEAYVGNIGIVYDEYGEAFASF
jgi:hypothetical protein